MDTTGIPYLFIVLPVSPLKCHFGRSASLPYPLPPAPSVIYSCGLLTIPALLSSNLHPVVKVILSNCKLYLVLPLLL